MKKALITLMMLVFTQQFSHASHLMGGEITWACQANGKYIFKMILYRDCHGNGPVIPAGVSLDVFGNPSLTTIPLNNPTITEITYCQNYPNNNCNVVFPQVPLVGTIQEGVYYSNPITLNGVPPAGGWTFVWHSCCRNAALDNVDPQGFSLRATMYPFNGQNANPCFDNSPAFAEKPKSVLCSSNPFVYNHGAFDDDLDSLNFEWGRLLEEPILLPPAAWNPGDSAGYNPVYTLFNPPYDYLNPLPFSPPNIGATVDPATGEINFTSFVSGNFATSVKVSSYKCGVKVSEIFREIQFVILNCDTNNNPAIEAPFQDTTGNYTLWADTVMAGDFVSFNLSTSDYDIDTSGNPQSVTLSGYGSQFGDNFTDTATGCLIPPCAVTNAPLPVTAATGVTVNFNWQTTVDHLGMFYPCAYIPNTYYFNFKSTDSHCPAPAVNYKTVSITVLPVYPKPTIQNNNGVLTCLENGFNYQWYMNRFQINGATSQSFTPLQQGMYQVRITDSIGSGNYSEATYVSVISMVNNQPSGLESIKLYPNPAHEMMEIEFTENFRHDVTLCLYDMTGRRVFVKELPGVTGNMKLQISLRDIPSGVYTFEIGNNVEMIRKKVVVAKD